MSNLKQSENSHLPAQAGWASKQNKIIIESAVIISLIIFFFAVANISGKSKVPGFYDKFAQCLAEKGAVMYGAEPCSHCKEQEAVFGDSFKFIKYVDCSDNPQFCIDKGIQGYPTWFIGTSAKLEGFDSKTMEALSAAAGCSLP